MSEGDLAGSLAVVTGGGSGIGQAICRVFAREGCQVVVADIRRDNAEETLKQLGGSGHCAMQVNVVSQQSVTLLFRQIKERYLRVPDVVVNCAGIVVTKNLFRHTESDFDNLINVNVKGTFLTTQEGCRCMIEEKFTTGSIVNISSMAAKKVDTLHSVYSASKGAVESFTRAVALEMAPHGIRVNCISPGYVNTPMIQADLEKHPEDKEPTIRGIPLGRMAKPDEMGEMCAFLACRKSSYMTGSVVNVSGGYGL